MDINKTIALINFRCESRSLKKYFKICDLVPEDEVENLNPILFFFALVAFDRNANRFGDNLIVHIHKLFEKYHEKLRINFNETKRLDKKRFSYDVFRYTRYIHFIVERNKKSSEDEDEEEDFERV
eukprot:TRINITY_DN16885_c0_g1_i1.p1 TRINITY_DN16885_c0_g1~~TRINITY_DN16885_c0_g1_i1.p1  ORF type:complete len:125 (-),score=6.59 TRINITY_DN16885_c0_g1_i1:91-465(-)